MDAQGFSGIGLFLSLGELTRRGLDACKVLAKVNLTREGVESALTGFPPYAEHKLFQEAGLALRDDAFALHLGANVRAEDYQMVWFLMSSQPTLRAALTFMIPFCHALNDVHWSYAESSCAERIELRPRFPLFWTHKMAEVRLRSSMAVMEQLSGTKCPPVEVHHSHPAPPYAEEYARSYGAPVRFNMPVDALVVSPKMMDLPCREANPRLSSAIHQVLSKMLAPESGPDWSRRVQQAILQSLSQGKISMEHIAAALKVPVRTLNYQLAREGTNFMDILDDLRKELALIQISRPGMTIPAVAEMLGFQDVRHFYRVFRKWTGTTPTQMRASLLGLPSSPSVEFSAPQP